MKTPFIPKLILFFILFFLYSAGHAQQRDSVTICGQVTDYNGQPIDSCSIFWQSPSFDDIKQAITDKTDTTPPVFLKESIKVWELSICLPTHIP